MTGTETIYIRNMVCPRCITVVGEVLETLGFRVQEVELGEAHVVADDTISNEQIARALQERGFGLVEGTQQQLVGQIKVQLVNYVKNIEAQEEKIKLSDFLTQQLYQNYASLSSAFSESEGTTIEKYLIYLKIERVKELLVDEEKTLSEIAFQLNYSSVAYLSNQFKKITGMSPTDYKKASESFRKPLDGVHDK